MSSNQACNKVDYAERFLYYFVEGFKTLYGQENISHNVHNVLHLTEDVRVYGPLDQFSEFCFENYMQVLKNKIRKHEKTLQQIIYRVKELDEVNINISNKKTIFPYPCFENRHFNGPIFSNQAYSDTQFMKLVFKNFTLSNSEPNNCYCCCLIDGTIVNIKNFLKTSDSGLVLVIYIKKKKNFINHLVTLQN